MDLRLPIVDLRFRISSCSFVVSDCLFLRVVRALCGEEFEESTLIGSYFSDRIKGQQMIAASNLPLS